eukprot:SAG31_NODE_1889_length_6986_cov_3.253666_3_plen_346_part_00
MFGIAASQLKLRTVLTAAAKVTTAMVPPVSKLEGNVAVAARPLTVQTFCHATFENGAPQTQKSPRTSFDETLDAFLAEMSPSSSCGCSESSSSFEAGSIYQHLNFAMLQLDDASVWTQDITGGLSTHVMDAEGTIHHPSGQNSGQNHSKVASATFRKHANDSSSSGSSVWTDEDEVETVATATSVAKDGAQRAQYTETSEYYLPSKHSDQDGGGRSQLHHLQLGKGDNSNESGHLSSLVRPDFLEPHPGTTNVAFVKCEQKRWIQERVHKVARAIAQSAQDSSGRLAMAQPPSAQTRASLEAERTRLLGGCTCLRTTRHRRQTKVAVVTTNTATRTDTQYDGIGV